MEIGLSIRSYSRDDGRVRQVKVLKGRDWNREPRSVEVHSISHLYPLELSLTHDHVVADNVDYSELGVDPIQFNDDDDLEINNANEEYSKNEDFAFNEQDAIDTDINSSMINNEHSVPQDIFPGEVEDIVSNDSQLTNLEIKPGFSQGIDVQLHPSGRPVRKVAGRGKPLDDQFLYEM